MSMQKGKHQGGQNQGFSRYPPNAYPQRQPAPQRGGDVYHVTTGYPPQGGGGPGGGGPSGGPQMRAMGMPMQQGSQQQGPGGPAPTSTPPGSGHGAADINKGLHMQGQGGMLPFQVTSAPRQSTANYSFQTRATPPRMPNRNQTPMFAGMGNGQQIVPGQHSYMQVHNNVYMPVQMYRGGGMNSGGPQTPFYAANQQQQFLIQAANMSTPHGGIYYPIQTVRQGPPGTVNLSAPPQGQQGIQTAAPHGPTQSQIIPVSGNIMPTVTPPAPPGGNTVQPAQPKRRKHALAIVDPNSGRDIIEDMEKEASASGGSSNRETPQPESLQNHNVAAEFAERVGKAASEDSMPSAPTQPPELGSLNGPAQSEPSSDPSLSQSSYLDDTSSIGNSWNKGGHKGPVDLGDKLHDAQPVYLYSPVIPNYSAKNMEIPEMYPSVAPNMPTGPIMVHHAGMMPPRPGTLGNSLALNEQTPVVSANTNAPSVPVEVYRARGPQQSGGIGSSGLPGSHPSPQRRKRQENSSAASAASNSSTNLSSSSSTESSSQYLDAKKKGSPTPAGIATSQASSQTKAQSGSGSQKEGKRDKGRDKTSAPKEVPKDVVLEKAPQPEKAEVATSVSPSPPITVKSKPSPAPTVSAPSSVTPQSTSSVTSSATTTNTSSNKTVLPPAAQSASVSVSPVSDVKSDKGSSARPKQSGSDSSSEPEGKATGRSKGKKMRDSNAKEKEGSDLDIPSEQAAPEESPVTTPTPSESASGSSPIPEPSSQPITETEPRPLSPAPAAPAPETPAPDTPAPTPVSTEPKETAVTLKTAPEPAADDAPAPGAPEPTPAQPVPADTSAHFLNASAISAAKPAPADSSAPAVAPSAPLAPLAKPVSAGNSVNFFNPPFAVHSPPVLLPKSNKENKEKDDKEDKLVAARNEENAKVSAVKDDGSSDLRRTYMPEQWSPANPKGKKKYDRSFLMDLRNDPQSQKKPDGLPDMDVVLKESNKKAMQNNFTSEFSPAGFIRSSGSRGVPPQRKSQQGKPKSGKPPVLHLSLSLREDVKLHETENAWKPGIIAGGKEVDEEEAKAQDLYKKVRGVLNKLTPEKFDKLVGQVQALPIETPERLKGVIDLVFDKAVDEPNFSVAYAKMCNELKAKEVQNASFRKMLVTRCQQEFEKNKDAENKNKADKLKQIENEPDPGKRKELQHMYEEEERKIRMKSVGNIRFIGELYKLGMLTGKIMFHCIGDLLSKDDEESYECLCKLLTTIGKKLEQDDTSDLMGSYFSKMKDLADRKGKGRNISSRVRFMLQDCIDLKANRWVPRRDDSNPKTMEEIQRESERETLESNIALSQPSTPRKDDRLRGMGGMDKRGGRGGMPVSDDGWKPVTSRGRPLDVNKLTKINLSTDTATLGSSSQFSKWGGGSGGSAGRDSLNRSLNRNVIAVNPNPYSALEKGPAMFNNSEKKIPSISASKDRSLGGERGSGSRSSSQQRMGSQPTSRDSSLARGKRDEERRNRVPTPTSLGVAVSDTTPSDDKPSPDLSDETETGPESKVKDEEEVCRMAHNRVMELLDHKNIEESMLAVENHIDWTNVTLFLREILVFMAERSQDHLLVSQFIRQLKSSNVMQLPHLLSALTELLELGPDLSLDIPKIWPQVATQIGCLLTTECLTFKDLVGPFSVLKGTKEAEILLKNLIQILIKDKGPSWIQDHWESSNVKWSDFLNSDDVDNFVKENKLESFSGGVLASRSEMTQAEIQLKLLELLESDNNFDAVQAWIESNVGDRTQESTFIRALMTAICENSITKTTPGGKLLLNSEKLRQDKLLLRYVDNKADLELQCLYAVQALVTRHQHPQGLIVSIFNTLWEDNLISTEAFQAWFESNDPQESEGKGVCRTSLASFQTLLAENDEEDDA